MLRDRNPLDKLATLIRQEHETIIAEWRRQVSQLPGAEKLDTPALDDHIPGFLKELSDALRSRSGETIAESHDPSSPPAHGLQRVHDGFDITEVVAEYNILRACIHDLANRNDLSLQGEPFHVLNRVLDGAIGTAVQTYATQRALEIQQRREEYLAFMAHDLRTPLNAIALAANALEMTLPERRGVDTTRMLKSLRRNVQQLEGLVDKVLEEHANLRTEVGVKLERRLLDLWPVVEGLVHDLHPVAGTGSTLLINDVPEELVVYADAELLRRILQNLISNAIRYTPSGEIIIGARELGDRHAVECWISDNGSGIPERYQDGIFDLGETDPNIDGGTGLGLAIVKTFVEAHGGKVKVESKEGLGSTFRFTLPDKPG
jgi:two-component system, OmpR family, phosphate regulon sensor histidine kinase PhoR